MDGLAVKPNCSSGNNRGIGIGGERNFGFDSLNSRLNRDMEEKGIVAQDVPGFLLNVAVHSGYVLDIELQVSNRSTQSVLEYIQNTAKSCVLLRMIL